MQEGYVLSKTTGRSNYICRECHEKISDPVIQIRAFKTSKPWKPIIDQTYLHYECVKRYVCNGNWEKDYVFDQLLK